MNTNPEIRNPYLRGLLARELMGYRKSYYISKRYADVFGSSINKKDVDYAYTIKRQVCRRCFGRFDYHLREHGTDIVVGNIDPLLQYASFAGH